MASYNVLIKKNNPYKIALYNTQLGAACNNHSNKVLAILLYKKQLSY